MNLFLRDLRFGLRILLQSPALTLVALTAILLGIAANSAAGAVVNSLIISSA